MRYIKIIFTSGLDQVAYQEIDDRGVCIRMLDEYGNDLVIPEGMITESKVVSEDADEIKQSIKIPYKEAEGHLCSSCGAKCNGK